MIFGDGGDISIKRLNDSVADIDNVVRSASDVSLLSSVSPASANFSCNIPLKSCSINNAGSSSGISLQSSVDSSVKSVLDSIAVNSPFDVPLETYSINNGVSALEIPLLSSVDSPVRTVLDDAVNSLSNVPLECYSIDNVVSASDVLLQSPVRSVADDTADALLERSILGVIQQPCVNLGIRMPPRFKPCGRPKGIDVTVVGLRRKGGGGGKHEDLKPFSKLHICTKKKLMLTWLVSEDKAKDAIKSGYKLVKCDLKKLGDINDAIIDTDLVDIKIVRPFFSEQAWDAIQTVLKRKEKKDDWKCSICDHSLDGQSICCNKCLQWQHLECADLSVKPKSRYWYCKMCRNTSKSTDSSGIIPEKRNRNKHIVTQKKCETASPRPFTVSGDNSDDDTAMTFKSLVNLSASDQGEGGSSEVFRYF